MSTSERHVRLFRNGHNQALRILREFELKGEEVLIHKEGDRLIVEPIRKGRRGYCLHQHHCSRRTPLSRNQVKLCKTCRTH